VICVIASLVGLVSLLVSCSLRFRFQQAPNTHKKGDWEARTKKEKKWEKEGPFLSSLAPTFFKFFFNGGQEY
jgi:hypothetical protein